VYSNLNHQNVLKHLGFYIAVGYMNVVYDSRVEKSLNRLRHMGLRVQIVQEGRDIAFIFIPIEDIIKLIQKQITYPSSKTYYEEGFIVVKVWRL
jgi:hypothetical protein